MSDLLTQALENLARLEKQAFVPIPKGQMPPPPPGEDPNQQAQAPQAQPPQPAQGDPSQGQGQAAPPQPPQPPQGDPNAGQQAPPPQQDPMAQIQEMVQATVIDTLQKMGIQPGGQKGQQEDPTGFGAPASHEEQSDRETTKAKVGKLESELQRLMSFLGIPSEGSYPIGGQPQKASAFGGFGPGSGESALLDSETMHGMDAGIPVSAVLDVAEDGKLPGESTAKQAEAPKVGTSTATRFARARKKS
ncbi:MAG: hypothetical protein D0530_04975 [Methylococcales bacterium]|nr:MAG: hypothetical protein D0530_04975 [Methylococcales bacterium]